MKKVFLQMTRRLGSVELVFPYDPDMVEAIKATVPFACRSYDPATHICKVSDPYTERAIDLFRVHFPHALLSDQRPGRQGTPPPPKPTQSAPHAVLHLLPSAPREVIDAAYKALVKLNHPDRLPSGERDAAHQRMSAINIAYERLRTG